MSSAACWRQMGEHCRCAWNFIQCPGLGSVAGRMVTPWWHQLGWGTRRRAQRGRAEGQPRAGARGRISASPIAGLGTAGLEPQPPLQGSETELQGTHGFTRGSSSQQCPAASLDLQKLLGSWGFPCRGC